MPFDIEAFALALKNLNGVRGRIAVKGPNAVKARKRMKQALDETRSYGVDESEVRATFSRGRSEVTELWLEPARSGKKN